MGSSVGTFERRLGRCDGESVGGSVGTSVGAGVGGGVGTFVGDSVAVSVGDSVGLTVQVVAADPNKLSSMTASLLLSSCTYLTLTWRFDEISISYVPPMERPFTSFEMEAEFGEPSFS